jgi:hypothetical protein
LNTKAVKEEKKRREKRKILKRRMTLSRWQRGPWSGAT